MGCVAFEETLSKIKGLPLGDLDEQSTKLGAILPLLRQAGWDTANPTEVRPELLVQSPKSRRKQWVDYALMVGGEVRILVEAKRWNSPLREGEENQLAGYCRRLKPNLAVLTSGNRWVLYLPPKGRKNDAKLRLFLEFDITALEPDKVQENFERFLARDRFENKSSSDRVVKEAAELIAEREKIDDAFRRMTAAWNSLTYDPQPLFAFIEGITDPHPDEEQVEQFVESVGLLSLVHQVTTVTPPPPTSKPYSFTFRKGDEILVKSHWSRLLVEVCLLMHERDPDKLRAALLAMPEGWFTESKPAAGKWHKAIGATGIYAYYGDGNAVKHRCAALLEEFGYPPTDLTIKSKNDAEIPLNPP